MRDAGEFLEWAEVFGQLYGTRLPDTQTILAEGRDLVLVIDVQGAAKVRDRGVPFVGIFLAPPSVEMLESRLRGRSEDSPEQIRRRLDVARREVEVSGAYDYLVVNDDLETCVAEVRGIVLAERARVARRWPLVTALLEQFRHRGIDAARQE
jgi:guanylate kinase